MARLTEVEGEEALEPVAAEFDSDPGMTLVIDRKTAGRAESQRYIDSVEYLELDTDQLDTARVPSEPGTRQGRLAPVSGMSQQKLLAEGLGSRQAADPELGSQHFASAPEMDFEPLAAKPLVSQLVAG